MFFLLIGFLLLISPPALADALITQFGATATTPLTPGTCIPIAQSGTSDAHWCNPLASAIGGLLIINNLSEVDPTTGRNNLRAAPIDSPTFTTLVNLPSVLQSANSQLGATTAFVKAQELAADASWVNQDPNNTCIHIAHQAEKVTGVTGRVTLAAGSGATVSAVKVPSGTAVSAGLLLTTAALPADASLNINQTLTLTATAANLLLAVGDAICLASNAGNFATSDGILTVAYVKQ